MEDESMSSLAMTVGFCNSTWSGRGQQPMSASSGGCGFGEMDGCRRYARRELDERRRAKSRRKRVGQ